MDDYDNDAVPTVSLNDAINERRRIGRPNVWTDPAALHADCLAYIKWCADNPLQEEKVFNGKDGISRTSVAKVRIPTLYGLWSWLNVAPQTWHNYRDRQEFIEVIRDIDMRMKSTKLELAAADLVNANIVARLIGLADNSNVVQTGTTVHEHKGSVTHNHVKLQGKELDDALAAAGLPLQILEE